MGNELYGEFNVSPKLANSDYHKFEIRNVKKGYTYFVHDFEAQNMAERSCSELIFNGNFDIGFAGVFDKWGVATLSNVDLNAKRGTAVQVSNRKSGKNGILYKGPLDFNCFTPGCTFQVSADLKMEGSTGNGAPCSITSTNPNKSACPAVKVEIKDTKKKKVVKETLRGYAAEWNPDGFNNFVATFSVPHLDDDKSPWNGDIKQINLGVIGFSTDYNLILDNLSLTKLHCDSNV